MDDLHTAETCDKCQSRFQILIKDFDLAMKDDLSILCPACNTEALNEQAEAEKLPDVFFKYKVVPTELADFDALGLDGWDLIAVSDGMAYFKRGYFREAT